MIELQDIVQRLRKGQSIKGIGRELKRHKTVIRKVKRIAEENNWLDSASPLPSEKEIKEAYGGCDGAGQERSHPLDAFKQDIEHWVEEGYSFVVMHKLLSNRVCCSESTVRRYVHRSFPAPLRPVMVRSTVPRGR